MLVIRLLNEYFLKSYLHLRTSRIIIITDVYSDFRSEDTEALDAAQEQSEFE